MKTRFPLDQFQKLETPFYYYDTGRLEKTLDEVAALALRNGFRIHYALKANANIPILTRISSRGFGADCVSGYEVRRALETGFKPSDVVFAGVGKADWEIEYGLDQGISCFNSESIQELEVIDEIAHATNQAFAVRFHGFFHRHRVSHEEICRRHGVKPLAPPECRALGSGLE